jgi:Tol biopolymer transport system component
MLPRLRPSFAAALALSFGVGAAFSADPPAGQEAQFLSNVRQLTFEGKRSGEGYFSPDGKSLIFQSEREPENPFYQIYLLELTNGDIHRVSPGHGKTTCSFFQPGSDRVLFASTHLDPEARAKQKAELEFRASGKQRRYSWDYDEHFDVFTARRDGSDLRRLTEAPGYDAEGAFSPDGKQIVFCSFRHAFPTNKLSAAELKRMETDPAWFGEIYVMDADGSNVRRLTDWAGYDGGPFFSPDGARILWRHFNEEGTMADVYTMKTDGSDRRRLTDFGAMSWAPYFHPSGKYVVFTANKLGFANFELFLVDAAGQHEPVRVTFTDGFDGLPVFSPDGAQLCWTSGRTPDGKSQLFLAQWNHEAALMALGQAGAISPPGNTTAPVAADLATAISREDVRVHVNYLASDALEGRATGSPGARLAADYIASQLRRAGLKPYGADGDYFQPFDFTAGSRVVTNANRLVVARPEGQGEAAFEVERDFRPLSFSANSEVEGDVVFVGYGLSVPGKPGEGYDSYAGVSVSNKVVLALRYVPEDLQAKRRQELNRYAGLRYKAMLARERGARAVLFVTGPTSPNAGELAALTSDGSLAGSGIVAASIGTNVASALLAGSGKDLKALQSALDTENPHAESGFTLPKVRVRLATAVEHLKETDRNVLAILPPGEYATQPQYVLVGAHYDHLGFGESGAMRRKGEEHQIHPGADDNASGTATVLELAASLAGHRSESPTAFRQGVLFAFWSGEEMGLIGSSHFAEHPPLALSNVVAYVNFDMVGRLRENKLNLQGIGSSGAWRRLIEKRNVAAGFHLVLQEDPYLPTDVTAFYPKGVPVLNFFTGGHEEYHRPADRPGTLNYEGVERVAQFAEALLLDLVAATNRPDYLVVSRSDTGGGSRENLRAYLGTIPDYATETAGVKLSGVRAGGPADKAGLKGGDIIVEFAGQKIANIYDYTYAMDAVKIGQPIKVVVLRAGERVSLTVVPEARK